MLYKIDWASLIVGSKSTVFALFYFVFKGNFPSTSPRGGSLYLEGRFNGGFLALPDWGAYTWRGLFSEFYGIQRSSRSTEGGGGRVEMTRLPPLPSVQRTNETKMAAHAVSIRPR